MHKDEIITTILYFSHHFPKVQGDLPNRYDRAEKLAEELLRYKDHDAWAEINVLWPKLPKNYKHD